MNVVDPVPLADGLTYRGSVMADGQSFSGTGALVDDLRAEFVIPLYARGRGRLVGELTFDATNPEGTVGGSVTWVKEEGVPGLPYAQAFVTTGEVIGGVYDPDELPGNTVNFTFGTDEDPHGTGTGTLASRFTIAGNNATGPFTLGNGFVRSTGLIIGRRPKAATNGPRTLAAVVLLEQGEVAGSSVITIPAETISAGVTLPAFNTAIPVTGTFPP